MEKKVVGIGLLASLALPVLIGIFFGSTSTTTYVAPFWKSVTVLFGLILILFGIYAAVLLLRKEK